MSKFFLGGKRMRMCRKTTNSLVCKKKTFTRKDDEEEYQPKEKKKHKCRSVVWGSSTMNRRCAN